MVSVDPVDTTTDLATFFNFLYGNQTGFAYLAFKKPPTGKVVQLVKSWTQEFYQWPEEQERMIARVQEKTETYEVYFGPALYNQQSAKKEHILGSNCVWAELDGLPITTDGVPPPSYKLQSSSDGHEHWYWKLDTCLGTVELETINRRLTFALGADVSGWDSTQVLRPPATYNHKRSVTTQILEHFPERIWTTDNFLGLPEPPELVEVLIPKELPPVEDVVSKYKIPANVWHLFKKGMDEGKRSDGLMALGYYLAELQIQDGEILAMLLNADERWGKFSGRSDQILRLSQIVSIARAKYPYLHAEPIQRIPRFGIFTLLESHVELKWIWEDFLQEAGYFLLTGPSGIGKTQMSLDFMKHSALGLEYLGKQIARPCKTGFLSLEMSQPEVKQFLKLQTSGMAQNEIEQLEELVRIYPLGEGLYLNKANEQEFIEELIFEEKLDGLIIDSLGAATEKDISQGDEAKPLVDWTIKTCHRHNCFIWFVHHHRKATGDNKRPNKLGDVYGNQVLTARATTVFCLWDATEDNAIWGIPLKIRLAPKPDPFLIYRSASLEFTKDEAKSGISVMMKDKNPNEITGTSKEPEKPKEPEPASMNTPAGKTVTF